MFGRDDFDKKINHIYLRVYELSKESNDRSSALKDLKSLIELWHGEADAEKIKLSSVEQK